MSLTDQMEISPTAAQDKFIFSNAPFPAMVAGFGAGKTEALVIRSIIGKINYPTTNRAFYEPTYDLMRQIAFPRFEEMLSELNIPYRLLKSPHNTIEIEHCGKIIFRSMDTPNRIIGYEVGDSEVDELDTLKPKDAEEVWRRILSRNRQKKADGAVNTVAVGTTPEGFGFVYKAWHKEPKQGYEIIRAPTASNPHLPPDYIESLRAQYPENLLKAYIEGEFVNLTSGNAWYGFDREKNHTDTTLEYGEALHIGMDFNVGNMAAVVYVIRSEQIIAVDELSGLLDTPTMARTIKERFEGSSIVIYPDASGGNTSSKNASVSDLSILRQHGFTIRAHRANPAIKDRMNATNAKLCNGDGQRTLLVNTNNCPKFTEALEQQSLDKNGLPDKSSGLDHITDAGTYPIAYLYPIVKRIAKQTGLRL